VLGGFNATPWSSKGPIWPSVGRGRPTEIEYLNSEVVRMGRKLQVPAPLNALAVTLVQRIASERRYLTVREIEDAAGAQRLTLINSRPRIGR